jgi:hypothetical protein
MEKEVKMAAKMYEMRDAAKSPLGEHYAADMQKHGAQIKKVAEHFKCSIFKAGAMMATEAGGGMMTILIIAATVEMIEPSNG